MLIDEYHKKLDVESEDSSGELEENYQSKKFGYRVRKARKGKSMVCF